MSAQPVCKAARGDIIDCQFYEEAVDNLPPKSFFPIDALRAYLTDAKIKEILLCKCPECRADLALFRNLDPDALAPQINGEQPDRRNTIRPAYALFSLLIYVEHPLLIIGFLDANFYDDDLERSTTRPSPFSAETLKHYTGNFSLLNPTSFKRFVKTFTAAVPEFAIPYMDSSYFSRYSANTTLPFVEEKEIGKRLDEQGRLTSEGANGRVFKFKIYKAYRKFPSTACGKGLEWFARKKIETPEFMAYMEKEYLQYAQRFRDDHIVRLVKAYRLGDTINLIFPLAKANLNHLLRDPNTGYGNERAGPLESCNAWKQLLGLAKALENIQGYKPDPSHSEDLEFSERLCIHFDLKPENILVETDGNWVIADFGQAAIIYAQYGRTPRVANHHGTDAYAPPEVDIEDMTMGRRYDVWSLGCIMLEVTAFVIFGYAGLKGSSDPDDPFSGLDEARQAKAPWSRHGDERFFYRQARNGAPVVKREICDFIDLLVTRVSSNPENNEKSKAFFDKIIHLINQMLEPNVENRIDIVEVVRTLSAAIKQASPDSALAGEPQMVSAKGECVIGGPALNSIHLWHKTETSEGWDPASVEAFESQAGYMRLHVWSSTRPSIDVNFPRDHVKIIPHYAFWGQSEAPASKTWIQLLSFSSGFPSEVPNARFSFSEFNALRDARIVQSKLTSQHIEASFAVASVKLDKFVSVPERAYKGMRRALGLSKARSKDEELAPHVDLGEATIQLWIEQVDPAEELRRRRQSSSSWSTESNRGVRVVNVNNQVRPRRVVIYLHRHGFICTIKMDVNWVLEENPKDELFLCFVPHEPGRDPHFVASWLRPTVEEQERKFPAGVPLNPAVLELLEELDHFEADRFVLRFYGREARNEFLNKYMDVKKNWDLQRQKFGKSQAYTPVNRRINHLQHSKHDFLKLKEQVPEKKAPFSSLLASFPEQEAEPEPELEHFIVNKGKGKAVEPLGKGKEKVVEPLGKQVYSLRDESDQGKMKRNSQVHEYYAPTNTDYLTVNANKFSGRIEITPPQDLKDKPKRDSMQPNAPPTHKRNPSSGDEKLKWKNGRGPNSRPPAKKK